MSVRSKEPPVIVSESDEGSSRRSRAFGEAAMRQIRVKGLVALSIPGVNGVRAPQPPNTVITLRYVYNKLFGTQYSMLPGTSAPDGDYP